MPRLETKPCNQVFENIYSGDKEDQVTFQSDKGIFVALAYKQATEGHSLVIPVECEPNLALLSAESRRKVAIVQAATKLWLQAAFDPEYVGGLDAGKEVRHAHAHVAPVNDRDFFYVMGSPDPQPFPEISGDRAAEVYAAATFHPEYAEAVEDELYREESTPPKVMQEMAYDLAQPITPRTS